MKEVFTFLPIITDLLMTVWGDDSYFNSRILDVYIRKLRNYFHSDSSVEIITLKGRGYIFRVPWKSGRLMNDRLLPGIS